MPLIQSRAHVRACLGARAGRGAKRRLRVDFPACQADYLCTYPQVMHNAPTWNRQIMDGFAFALIAASFVLSVLACLSAVAAVTRVSALARRPAGTSESVLRSVRQSVAEVESALQELATTVRMMKARRAARMPDGKPASDAPDPYTEPDRWRSTMTARLTTRGKTQ